MTAYILRRLWQMIPTLAGVILLIFFIFKAFGGDPAEILGGQAASQEQIDLIRKELGLDQPWWVQLWIFVQDIFTFDFGKSWMTKEQVSAIFLSRLPATLTITLPILLLEVLLAIRSRWRWPTTAASCSTAR
ncbi:MAG: pore protein [Pseudomonadota bacterium]